MCCKHATMLFYQIFLVSSWMSCVLCATRCYDQYELGCYDSKPTNTLPQDPAHVRTSFTLSCRKATNNATLAAVLTTEQFRQNIEKSCFQAYRETKFIIHGFTDSGQAEWIKDMRDAFLLKDDYNVVAVDWHHGGQFPYVQAVANSAMVARQVARFITHIIRVQGLDPRRIHIVGHSLGAQISGNAASNIIGKVARVTALDPAEPYFHEMPDSRRLDATDALYVEVIHTDGEAFTGFKGYGSLRRQGHVDLYPNGGISQPGCIASQTSGLLNTTTSSTVCSHVRAIPLYQASLQASPSCTLTAFRCNSSSDFDAGLCHNCTNTADCITLGDMSDKQDGSFYLSTSLSEPFCGEDYQITMQLSQSQQHAYGRIYLDIADGSAGSGVIDFSRNAQHHHSNDTVSHVTTVRPGLGDITSVQWRFDKGSGLSSLGSADDLDVDFVRIKHLCPMDCFNKEWQLCPTASKGTTGWQMMTKAACSVSSSRDS